jgi:hypothetical protein
MSEMSQGPGWWLASDGRWYPPEQHPGYVPTPPPVPPIPPPGPPAQSPYGFPPAQSPYGFPPAQSPYAFAAWPGQPAPSVTSGLAIAALVLSILWIGGVGSLLAVIFGIVALSQIRSSSGRRRGQGLATSGLVIGALGLVGTVALYSSGAVTVPPSSSSPSAQAPGDPLAPRVFPATSDVLIRLANVSPGVMDQVGVPSPSLVTPPTIRRGQPKLVVDGRPGAVFVGGVFCPYCAVERWAIIMAFSRFGTFSGLHETTSSPWDVYPSTATFSFHGATYSSRYIALAMAEHAGNDVDGSGTEPVLDPLTAQEATLWQRYDDSDGYPFLDIGNEAFVLSPSFSPSLLSGMDQTEIASGLTDPGEPSTQAIVGTANYLTAAICATTGQAPLSVCAMPVVVKAARAMDLTGGERLAAHRLASSVR